MFVDGTASYRHVFSKTDIVEERLSYFSTEKQMLQGIEIPPEVAIYFAYYNFCRVHQTLRVTPAMQMGTSRSGLVSRRTLVAFGERGD